MAEYLAAKAWSNNAAMMADVHRMGYLNPGDDVIDLTFGEGNWWTGWRGSMIVPFDGDFTATGFPGGHWDVVAYDPPYVATGGRETTTIPEFYRRYGLVDCPENPPALQQLMHDGLTEAARIVKPKGYVLAKSMNYVSSGRLWLGTHYMVDHALDIGLEVVDLLTFVGNVRAQPKGRRQLHFRNNASHLLILQQRGRKRRLWPVTPEEGTDG